MAQKATTDGGTDPMNNVDDRLAKIETLTISFETFKKALKRNYLGEPDQWGRSYVLRLYPPFEAEMEADYYESEQGTHYNNEWDEKPVHINPEYLIREGTDSGFRGIVQWPTTANTRDALSEDDIEEMGGIETALEEGREIFWHELRHSLPDEIDLGQLGYPYGSHVVDIEWED